MSKKETEIIHFETEDDALAKFVLESLAERRYKRVPSNLHCLNAHEFSYRPKWISTPHTFLWNEDDPPSDVMRAKIAATARIKVLRDLADTLGNPLPYTREQLSTMLNAKGIESPLPYMSKYLRRAGVRCIDRRARK